MIAYLRGKIVEKNFGNVVMDVNGIGYRVNVTLHTYMNFSSQDEITLHIYHHIWQDGQELYGFLDKTEREVFRIMTGISGVGPKLACRILQNIDYSLFTAMISDSNLAELVKINGLGKKTAEKLIFELKDKFTQSFSSLISQAGKKVNEMVYQAVGALISLGYKERDARSVIESIYEKKNNLTIENLIKEGLSLIYGK